MNKKAQHATFEENAARVVSFVQQKETKPTVNELTMSIIIDFGKLARYCYPEPTQAGRDHVRITIGDILVKTIAQAIVSNAYGHEIYKLTEGTVLPFGGAVTALVQSTYCQYRVHAASHDLEKLVEGTNPMTKDQFQAISHERAESGANLYKSLRTFAMEFDLDLEDCLGRSVKRLYQGVKIL